MEDIDGVESEADGGAEERTRANITRLMNRLAVALALQVFAHAAVRRALKRSLRARCWTCGAAMIQGFGVGERISGVLWEIWSKCTLPKNAVELPKPSQIISFQENNPAWNCFSVFRSVGEHEMIVFQKRTYMKHNLILW